MNEKDFINTETGTLFWEQNGAYYRFEPNALPFDFRHTHEISKAFGNAIHALGRLDGLTEKFTKQEVNLLSMPFRLKEAQLSSAIEGTRTTLTDVYKEEKQKEPDVQKRIDNEIVRNLREALDYGLNHTDISEDLIKHLHKILLRDVRGSDKQPGEYKTQQNSVGDREDTLETAKFVPASPNTTPHLMKNLIEFINNNKDMHPLYKIAVAHYQFETIHPFRDGNGRLGRALITFMLCREGILKHPLIYISGYFNRNRSTYTDRLYGVSSKNEIGEWIIFFLNAIETQANKSIELLQKLEDYKKELHAKTQTIAKGARMHLVVDSLFKNPFIRITDVAKEMNVTIQWASILVHKLEKMGVLQEITGKSSRKVFAATKILDILNS